MSEPPENTALAEILSAIADRRIRRKVQKLLQLGEEAVRALGELDAALYVREGGEAQMQIVSDAVLSHLRRLIEYLRVAAAETPETPENPENAAPAEPAVEKPSRNRPSIRTIARGAALGIAAARNKTDDEKWRALTGEMDTLHYGLSSELREYDRRFGDALSNDRKEQALTDLNDATTALMDGVFAAMTTVYSGRYHCRWRCQEYKNPSAPAGPVPPSSTATSTVVAGEYWRTVAIMSSRSFS